MIRYIYMIFYFHIVFMNKVNGTILYDFRNGDNFNGWSIVNDAVMGGVSSSSLKLDQEGNALFSGYVSLKNYGGFSSIRCVGKKIDIGDYKYIVLKIFGDNKYYQLRIRSQYYHNHVYVKKFYAKNEWQEIKISLNSMEPQFRGKKLNMRNFNDDSIIEFGILIGNKVEENFFLLIDSILLQ